MAAILLSGVSAWSQTAPVRPGDRAGFAPCSGSAASRTISSSSGDSPGSCSLSAPAWRLFTTGEVPSASSRIPSRPAAPSARRPRPWSIRERDVGKFVRGVGAELRRPADRRIREESILLRVLGEPLQLVAALGNPEPVLEAFDVMHLHRPREESLKTFGGVLT